MGSRNRLGKRDSFLPTSRDLFDVSDSCLRRQSSLRRPRTPHPTLLTRQPHTTLDRKKQINSDKGDKETRKREKDISMAAGDSYGVLFPFFPFLPSSLTFSLSLFRVSLSCASLSSTRVCRSESGTDSQSNTHPHWHPNQYTILKEGKTRKAANEKDKKKSAVSSEAASDSQSLHSTRQQDFESGKSSYDFTDQREKRGKEKEKNIVRTVSLWKQNLRRMLVHMTSFRP